MREKIACRGNYSTCAKVIIDLSRIFKHGNSQVEPLKVQSFPSHERTADMAARCSR